MTRITKLARLATLAAMAALASACSLSDPSYQPGELGNGGFYFSCDDAARCSKYSDDAAKFPKAVSLGSTFSVRFVPKESSGLNIHFNDSAADRGVRIGTVADFLTSGPKGLTAVKAGFATLTSTDASDQLIDYTVIRVAKPDNLAVYESGQTGAATPVTISTIELAPTDRKSYRAFGREGTSELAGSLQVEWTSSDASIVMVESTTDGIATLVAKAPGSATLKAVGGTFTQMVPVTVKQ